MIVLEVGSRGSICLKFFHEFLNDSNFLTLCSFVSRLKSTDSFAC